MGAQILLLNWALASLGALSIFAAHAGPGGGSTDERNPKVSMEVQSVATFEFQAASIGVAAHWAVDRASRPGKWCLVRWEEATQDLKSDNRTIAQCRVWVVLVTEFATLFVEGRVQPHDPPQERASALFGESLRAKTSETSSHLSVFMKISAWPLS
jgi:hypothetical protein